MKVYRIQSKQDKTRGAYSRHYENKPFATVVKCMMEDHNQDTDEHPLLHQDGIKPYRAGNDYCGCASAAQLLRWFKGYIPRLLRAGYEIVVLNNVKIVAIGKHQLLFNWID